MKVINEGLRPVKMRLDEIEEGALEQIKNLSNLPFVHKRVAIMPDSHQGYGMPIGGVLATEGVVIPNAVGVDIGCGMYAVRTSVKEISVEKIKSIMEGIRKAVPVGFNHHAEKQDRLKTPGMDIEGLPVVFKEYQKSLYSIGTLGGGNHFIEIQKGSDGYVWVMIHSGSRNLGKQVADFYNDLAVELNKKRHSSVPKEFDLAFLPIDSKEGRAYIQEMQYCVERALANRREMMTRIYEVFRDNYDGMSEDGERIQGVEFDNVINIAHNYARMENHFGKNVMVHRKGATSAKLGERGIIPGSQGTSSYIVKGLGNKDSFESCSHGAGRKMGRREASKNLNLEEEIKKLDDQGIVHGIRNIQDLDEASGAYKDIDIVMENQKDLVEIVIKLSPLGVIKG